MKAFAQRHRYRHRRGLRWRWGSGREGGQEGASPWPLGPGYGRGKRLCDLGPGEEAEVAFVDAHNMRDVQKFIAMGVLPGARVKLIQKLPVCVFRIGESEFAIDNELSRTIYLKA